MLDMKEDLLIANLKTLCQRFSADPLQGRYEVARQTGLSEQYLYQIISGRPMANGKLRSVGARARKTITEKFPNWLDSRPQESLPKDDQDFVHRVEEAVARYTVSDEAKRIILATIHTQPKRQDKSDVNPEAKAA